MFVSWFLCVCEDGYLGGDATDRREILQDGRYGSQTVLFPFEGYPKGPPKSQILSVNILQMVIQITCQMVHNIGSTGAL